MDTLKHIAPLIAALDAGYKHRPHEMLGWFLSDILAQMGRPEWMPLPEDIRPKIGAAIETYADLVKQAPPFHDLLGPLYMEIGSRGGRQQLGQFFTPWPIASMMARMTMGGRPSETVPGRLLNVCDPAVGSGVMMLSFAEVVLEAWGPDELRLVSVTGCDLDGYCARMFPVQAMVNCAVHGLQLGEIVAYRGNSLSAESPEIVLHASAPGMPVAPANHPARVVALKEAAGQQAGQLQLFAELAA